MLPPQVGPKCRPNFITCGCHPVQLVSFSEDVIHSLQVYPTPDLGY